MHFPFSHKMNYPTTASILPRANPILNRRRLSQRRAIYSFRTADLNLFKFSTNIKHEIYLLINSTALQFTIRGPQTAIYDG